MATITSKLQVTIPKVIATRFGLRPGDEIDFVEAGDVIRVIPSSARQQPLSIEERLRSFDRTVAEQRAREAGARRGRTAAGRGWTREELYADRGRAR